MNAELDMFFNGFRELIKFDEVEITKRETQLKAELINRFGEEGAPILCQSILQNPLKYALIDYLTGRFSMVYIELHSVLERISISVLPNLLTGPKNVEIYTEERGAISKLLERKNLSDLTSIFMTINKWDNNHEKKVQNLVKKRNGIAHLNPSLISKNFNNGQYINFSQINDTIKKDKNMHCVIVDTMELIYKIISD